jgi:uncharacterized protein with FMN-binding domain
MVSRADRLAARRNAGVAAASGVAIGLLFFFPTSTNHLDTRPGQAAASAIVAQPAADVPVGAAATSATGSTSAKATSAKATTVDGPSVDTRFGPVQVRLQLKNGKVVSAEAIDYPQSNRRDVQINSYAVPVLNGEAVDAQSASIDTVSGATFTSMGYKQSLQAALDAAHLT